MGDHKGRPHYKRQQCSLSPRATAGSVIPSGARNLALILSSDLTPESTLSLGFNLVQSEIPRSARNDRAEGFFRDSSLRSE